MPLRVAQVLLDSPLPQLDHLFDYAIPDSLAEDVVVGGRVRVPLRMGNRRVDAHVIHIVDSSSFGGTLQPIDSVITAVPILPAPLFDLARRVADRQAGSASDVLRLAIPPRYVRAEKSFVRRHLEPGTETDSVEPINAVDRVEQAPNEPFADFAPGECRSILMPAGTSERFEASIPRWVEHVAQAAATTHAAGESCIIVLPSYRDVDDVVAALTELGAGAFIVRSDTRQTGAERYSGYLRTLQPEPVIVVGNRSAVYVPAHNLGLIILWDDGDSVLQEPLAPYAHPRDVALLSAQLTGARLAFAGFVVSVEVQRLVDMSFATSWSPLKKAYPTVVPTDSLANEQNRSRIPSVAWAHAREQAKLGPVLVQVARPGYAPSLCCANCRVRAVCSSCSGPLASTSSGAPPTCRWCGQLSTQWRCVECSGTTVRLTSSGTERTAEDLGRAFPGTRIIVSDGAHPVTHIGDEPAVVVATPGAEPIASSGYRSVLILDGESHRSRAGLRVDENAVRNWVGALCLASPTATCYLTGAGTDLGATIASWSLRDFARTQLAQRRSIGLPPTKRAAVVTGLTSDVSSATDALRGIPGVKIMGPTTSGEVARAIVLFEYRNGDVVSAALRAAVVVAATRGSRRRTNDQRPERVVRLRVRLDDAELEDSI